MRIVTHNKKKLEDRNNKFIVVNYPILRPMALYNWTRD
nr:MAG TPA: hypothetical protein [Caudoviricetes sp.]DAJ83054.1 MAG TPA: hypothetical protein [Caudoviricetes sp.]DAV88855.1 MAG TPA: hypothetical protein [Caudoviricetes sp.]